MKTKVMICTFLIALSISVSAQSQSPNESITKITIEECYEWSRLNFPLIKQMDIIDKTTQFSLSNASNGNLPQVSLNGQVTYQSAVTELPIKLPNTTIPTVDKNQYKVYGEIYQPLTNFPNVNARKEQIELNGEIEKKKVEIDLFQIKERINQIYFGALLINEKIDQFGFIKVDLDSALTKVEAAITNGTATKTDKHMLQVERISIDQQIQENKSNQKAFLKMLSVLTGKNISVATLLIKPGITTVSTTINRPELQLFTLQNQSLGIQEKQLNKSLTPNVGLFAQGGYGKPALNFLSNDFEFYYIGGLKFNWNISSLYSLKSTKNILSLATDRIAAQQETFLLNTTLAQSQQSAEVLKYQELLKSDKEIITLREKILATAKVQLNNGLITTIDYVKFLNDVNKAKQTLILHQTQFHLAQYNLKTTTGN